MSLIELTNVSRYYKIDKNKTKYVLKNISITFPHTGFVGILGKSGSGKSTLLNLIGKLDNPSEGKIFFNGEDIAKYKEKKLVLFRSLAISYIFQHYHLLENQTALFNVMLPSLISGHDYKTAEKEATKLLESFSINKDLFDKKCANLSGGEKERIAILRSLINKPKVILADEPTGALDKNNAVLVMEELKKRSKNALVIMVTHNQKLAQQYCDRIIHMKDGRIVQDERINNTYQTKEKPYLYIKKSNTKYLNKIISTNFIKRLKRNIFSVLGLTIGAISSMLIFGFANGKNSSISKSIEKQFDFGSATINKENKIASNDSPITLIQTIRPSEEEMIDIANTCTDFHIGYSYDALISPYPEISVNESTIEELSYQPIYSFIDESIDHSLLSKGKIPTFDTLNQVVINETAYKLLNKTLKYDSLNTYIRIKEQHSYNYVTNDSETPYITDYFIYDRLVQIVGVVKEMTFLNTPKIYYSYLAMDKYMDEILLNNLSSYQDIMTWKERVAIASNNEAISSYTCRLFLKDINHKDALKNISNELKDYAITSNALTIEETLFTLVDAASVGMEIFLGIALMGIAMIIGILSFASYNEDIKDSAILLSLGARRDDIALIYIIESVMLGVASLLLSFLLVMIITHPINMLIEYFTSLTGIIQIPFIKFHNRLFLFPILIIVSVLTICFLSTYIPIGFSKRISLKEELNSND